ncbi:MAG: hypothetical protein JWN01_850 [Patescibacteria group bacterium]|nr:hypothetical protein [Patescibacteria group bacterium]
MIKGIFLREGALDHVCGPVSGRRGLVSPPQSYRDGPSRPSVLQVDLIHVVQEGEGLFELVSGQLAPARRWTKPPP